MKFAMTQATGGLRVPPQTYLRTPSTRNLQQKWRIRDDTGHHGSWWVRVFWHQRGTNRPTCGLRISDEPPSDNLTLQETTIQDASDIGTDGTGLSCPGSSEVVTEEEDSKSRLT